MAKDFEKEYGPEEEMPDGDEPVVVVFRIDREGDLFALFPELDEGNGRCACYVSVGGHTAAPYGASVNASRPARPEEYAAMKTELERAPYNYKLTVRQRWTRPRGR